jgi:hypothetical protein
MKKTLGILSALMFVSTAAQATTLLWMDVGDLTRNSTSVVQGRVVAQATLSDQPGVALNQVTLDVVETFKGDLRGTVLVNNPGFNGAPAFADGDELILFVCSRSGTNVITGFQQGSFKIVQDAEGGRQLDRGIPLRDKTLRGTRSVEALVNEIRNAVE